MLTKWQRSLNSKAQGGERNDRRGPGGVRSGRAPDAKVIPLPAAIVTAPLIATAPVEVVNAW
eukprot:11719381-Heterocapsa_arctica.AAC.1